MFTLTEDGEVTKGGRVVGVIAGICQHPMSQLDHDFVAWWHGATPKDVVDVTEKGD